MSGKAAWDEEPSRARRELKLHASELDDGPALRTPPGAAHPVRPRLHPSKREEVNTHGLCLRNLIL